MLESVSDGEDVVVPVGEKGVLVDRDVVEFVAQPGARNVVGAHVQRDRDEQVDVRRGTRSGSVDGDHVAPRAKVWTGSKGPANHISRA